MHVIAIDVYGYHQENFLTLLDLYSDRLFAYKIPDKSQEAVKQCVEKFIVEYGLPVQILSDNGREFLFIEELGIFHRRTANYRPESNGRIERKHLELSHPSDCTLEPAWRGGTQ